MHEKFLHCSTLTTCAACARLDLIKLMTRRLSGVASILFTMDCCAAWKLRDKVGTVLSLLNEHFSRAFVLDSLYSSETTKTQTSSLKVIACTLCYAISPQDITIFPFELSTSSSVTLFYQDLTTVIPSCLAVLCTFLTKSNSSRTLRHDFCSRHTNRIL